MYIHVNLFKWTCSGHHPYLGFLVLERHAYHSVSYFSSCALVFHNITISHHMNPSKHLLGTSASLRTFGSFTLLTKKIRYDDVRTATPVPLRLVNILASINFVSFASYKNNHVWKIMLRPLKMHNNDMNKFHDTFNYCSSY